MNKMRDAGFSHGAPLEVKDASGGGGEVTLLEAKKAVEELNSAFSEFKAKNDERLAQLEERGEDAVTVEQVKKIESFMDDAQARLDAFEVQVKNLGRFEADEEGHRIDLQKKAVDWHRFEAGYRGPDVWGVEQVKEYRDTFIAWARTGVEALEPKQVRMLNEIKALSAGTNPDGGYLVTPDMSGRTVQRIFETSPVRAYAAVQPITTGQLEGIHDNDEFSAGWVSELGSRAATATAQLGKWAIPVHEMFANPAASQTILDDAILDVEAWIGQRVGEKFGRVESAAFVNGTGVGQPRGFLTYPDWTAAGTYEQDAIEQFDTGVNGAYAAAPAGGDVLIQALYGLKQQYRANATWFMNRATASLTRRIKDSDGAYVWSPGIAAGQPASLLGYPVASFEDMPDPGTGTLSVAVGDMRAAYQIVDRAGIRTLRDPYSSKPSVHFYSTKRVGGDVIDFEALKIINFKA